MHMLIYILYNFRFQVAGALSGNLLGEASHRLIRNSLQIKPSSSSAGLLDVPYRGGPHRPTNIRPRPAGPYSYADENTHNHYTSYQGDVNHNPNPNHTAQSSHNSYQHNVRFRERPGYNVQAGMSRLTIGQQYTREPNAVYSGNQTGGSETISFGQTVSPKQVVHHPGMSPPFPPNNWIGMQGRRGYNGGGSGRGGLNEKRPGPNVMKVYRVKSDNSVLNEEHDPLAKSF
jgi:5'-3' exoribonuclease 4